jgi:hypothetical protein
MSSSSSPGLIAVNSKKRARESSGATSNGSSSTTSADNAAGTSAKTERNRKKKQKKRAKKRASANKAQRRAEKRHGGDKEEDDDESEEEGDSRDEVEALLLDGHVVGESSKTEEDAQMPPSKRQRDFSGDLKLYLDQWQAHQHAIERNNKSALQYSPWKFNKVLQAWSLDHCLQKQKISLELFKQLLLYIASVRGGARERLREQMITFIQEKDGLNTTDPDIAGELKRAKKVLVTLGKSDELVNTNAISR